MSLAVAVKGPEGWSWRQTLELRSLQIRAVSERILSNPLSPPRHTKSVLVLRSRFGSTRYMDHHSGPRCRP